MTCLLKFSFICFAGILLLPLPNAYAQAGKCASQHIACPVGLGCTVNSPFGKIRFYPEKGRNLPHGGVDLFAPGPLSDADPAPGTSIIASARGKVTSSSLHPALGWMIDITTLDGSTLRYAHLKKGTLLPKGASVKVGDQIARSNNSGKSRGPHLHFEYFPNPKIYRNPSRIDPMPCIESTESSLDVRRDLDNIPPGSFSQEPVDVKFSIDGRFFTSVGDGERLRVSGLKSGTHALRIYPSGANCCSLVRYKIRLMDGWKSTLGATQLDYVLASGAGYAIGYCRDVLSRDSPPVNGVTSVYCDFTPEGYAEILFVVP